MKVKTYKNRSLQEGIDDIKRDLGSEALILSTRSVSVRPRFSLFKKPAWEITAALEEKPALPAAVPTTEPSTVAAVYDRRESVPEKSPAVTDRRYSGPAAAAAPALAPAAAPVRDQRMEALID